MASFMISCWSWRRSTSFSPVAKMMLSSLRPEVEVMVADYLKK
jgi:hypothetical protein